jgi:zinc transport system substrate-binding protein
MRYFFTLICFLLVSTSASAASNIVAVSIKPLHSLATGITQGSGIEPVLLVDGRNSLHDFSLKPSQAATLHKADIVFYMGGGLEQFLEKILPQLPAGTQRVAMEKAEGMALLPMQPGDAHDHDEHEEHDEHGAYDLHAWMSVANARAMVVQMTETLSQTYPEQAFLFEKNAKKMEAHLDELDADLRGRMKKLQGKPFAVFHPAYRYFEHSYGLFNIGVVNMHIEQAPSAGHMQKLRAHIREMKAHCIFREPQFDSRVVDNLMQGTNIKTGTLDPEGALFEPGPDLYFQLMQGLASGLEKCLL